MSPVPIPKATARISRPGEPGSTAIASHPEIIRVRIPQNMWWMWVPPTSRLPGHQLTPARIMWALVRMKPNESRNATRKRNAGSLPASTIPSV